ncbi:2-amino-4-hydroxy-6-hydroxymethyldihydropteridine diphosphokinase [Cytophagaceae bacterium 50C-KIRBA]|uniref:2-amino-4-hydroxy-6-hydroxymethyldihydropteridine pyrophosphokinase n=2 Tax=Aquirufa beregesia TaxID=2516556 RepID=A0ABX0EXW4_9BACT|nr:2-amino-4-hydroxy-6-hydroxymethyldihydropteridine diphosphokinase [Aquirufa beregesia]NGZ44151.1 2-amino-4-hydroxy-6-hydroxymethyldihydropteridine diphosphokinase [Aquirufa beregesia]
MATNIYLSLGGNLGNTLEIFKNVYPILEKKIGPILHFSSIYQTKAWGNTHQADFLNQVLKLSTELNPQELIAQLLLIESELGRVRKQQWEARIIDLDILFYGHQVIQESNLQIPHPFLPQRKFVLIPLTEIAPNLTHPILQKDIHTLLLACPDSSEVKKLEL